MSMNSTRVITESMNKEEYADISYMLGLSSHLNTHHVTKCSMCG